MQFQFLLHLPLLLCFNGNNVDAKRSLSTSDSILNYLVEQSLQAKSDLSRITNEDIQIGKRTIKISTSSTNRPRILDDEIVLIFHADGSIRTYDTEGQSSVLMRAGNFQIDSEIFNLVFPGFSMDTAGSTTTTEKELSNLEEGTTISTTTPKPTSKLPSPTKSPKSSDAHNLHTGFNFVLLFLGILSFLNL